MSDKTSKKLRTLICGDKMLAATATTTMQNTHIQQQKKRAGSISWLNGEVAVKAATIGKEVAATSQPQKLQQQQSQYKRKRAESKK